MKKICLIFMLIVMVCSSISAQYYTNRNKVWVFGRNAGVNFTSGSPVAFTSKFDAGEGNATVSDLSGNLLFYTDGQTVRNRNDSIMPSGAAIVPYATGGATQAALIVPVLSDPDQYYVFSMEEVENPGVHECHLAYSIVDMTLNGGLGDVVTSSMGTPIDSVLGEKMIAIAGNDCNIWLLVHKKDAAKFEAFEITHTGINLTPVVSSVGLYTDHYVGGVIKVSPDRHRIVNMNNGNGAFFRTELYDFDPNTGLVSNFSLVNTYSSPYGAEFSPDNTKLYTTYKGNLNAIFQYDIALATTADIAASEYKVTSLNAFCDLKLAPDNKIYFKSISSPLYLDCISAPNDSGAACSYINRAVNLLSDSCLFGLPNTVWAPQPFLAITGDTALCQGSTTTLSNTSSGGTWSSSNTAIATIMQVPGGAAMVSGISAGTAIITYATPNCGFVTANVNIYQMPVPITGPASVCTGNAVALGSSPSAGTWSSNNTTVAIINSIGGVTGLTTGTAVIAYSLTGGCFRTASITVNPTPSPIAGNTHLCSGQLSQFNDGIAGGTWSSSDTDVVNITPATGTATGVSAGNSVIYYTTDAGCAATATILVTLSPDAGMISGHSRVCLDTLLMLQETVTGGVWSSSNSAIATINDANGNIRALGGGVVIISYTNGPDAVGCIGVATYTITISSQANFSIVSNVSQVTCYDADNGSITINISGGVQPFKYSWSNASTDSVLTGLTANNYVLTVTELATQCIATDTFHIVQPDSLHVAVEVINDKCKAGGGSIDLLVTGGVAPCHYLWADSVTSSGLQNLHSGTYTVTVTDSNSCAKTMSIQVGENNCDLIIAHDVITPNADGINDTWVIEGLSVYPGNTVQVFDKWGSTVFEKTNYNNDWGGSGKSGELPDGTYFYLIKLNAPNTRGGPNTFTGAVLIKR